MVSNSQRLEQIYGNDESTAFLVNRELTLPCAAQELEFDKKLSESEACALRQRISDLLRVIVAPEAVSAIRDGVRDEIRVLASPYECGRLLEDDKPVMIDGIPHVLTVKGVGCTTFGARELSKSRFFPSDLTGGVKMPPEFRAKIDREKLERFKSSRTSWGCGTMGIMNGRVEFGKAGLARQAGFDVERCVALHKITAMSDQHGELRDLPDMEDMRCIANGLNHPVLLFRALKSNFRLLDFINLLKLDNPEILKRFIDHAHEQYCIIRGNAGATLKDYFDWLSSYLLEQSIGMFFAGFPDDAAEWQTQARNCTIMGESVDLEGGEIVQPYKLHLNVEEHFIDLCGNFDFHAISMALCAVALNRAYPGTVDLKRLADDYVQRIGSGFSREQLKKIHSGFGQYSDDERDFRQFSTRVKTRLFASREREDMSEFPETAPFCERLRELVQWPF